MAHVARSNRVDAEITLDAVDLCRAIGNRMPEAGLAYSSTGDTDLARTVIDAAPALAVV